MLAKKLATRFPVFQSLNTKHFFFRNCIKMKESNRFQLIWTSWDILSLATGGDTRCSTTLLYTLNQCTTLHSNYLVHYQGAPLCHYAGYWSPALVKPTGASYIQTYTLGIHQLLGAKNSIQHQLLSSRNTFFSLIFSVI